MNKGFIFPVLPEIQVQEKLLWRKKSFVLLLHFKTALGKEKRLRQEIGLGEKTETGQHVTTADTNTAFGSTGWAKKRCRHYLYISSITKTVLPLSLSSWRELIGQSNTHLLSLRERRKEIEEVSDKAFKK